MVKGGKKLKDKSSKIQIVKKLIEKGKKNNSLTYKEIMNELEEVDLNPEQIEKIYEALESMGIEVIGDMHEEASSGKSLDLSVPEGISIDDPVRIF